ncbi:hypothetical protein QTP70_013734 [Hemibagrus guttatus]|uniref:Gypsy retrotransposon integrase-like protein 1 n=1 Tax=Hemibagrus guttatus TaxID=175788 RepID=A0AAE0PW16_9TELE|nr:hypothetical protein QTP70_013734 [Hemibagrus guttatus]
MMWGIESFSPLKRLWKGGLEGARRPFLVLTDHRNLEYLCEAKCPNPRQARWALFFTRFQFSVTYHPRSKNGKADIMSQQLDSKNSLPHPEPILPSAVVLGPIQWNLVEGIQRAHAEEPPPTACPPLKRYMPTPLRHQVIQWTHESPSNGQPGIHRTMRLVQQRFWWPSAVHDIERYVREYLQPWKQPPLCSTRLPEDIFSARGPQFTSWVWQAFCEKLGINVSLSSGYHMQSNDQAERLNQEIGRFLRAYCSREQHRWSEFLPWAEYAQNSLMHSSTGLTPFQCILGYHPPLFPWSEEPSDVPTVDDWARHSQEVWE